MVFPEKMKKIDANNPSEALLIIEHYMRYMSERIEFSNKNLGERIAKLEDNI